MRTELAIIEYECVINPLYTLAAGLTTVKYFRHFCLDIRQLQML